MKFNRIVVHNRSFLTKLLYFLTGIYVGLTISNWLHGTSVFSATRPCAIVQRTETLYNHYNGVDFERPRKISDELDTKQLLFAGIMTAEKFLHSRASVVYNTWGKNVPGRLVFFAGNKREASRYYPLPLVSLNGVDDSYPPQRKSLMMLKYMHDNFIDEYEWFMRCDDDIYIRTDKLEELLRGFDSSEELFIGQAGQGTQAERGLLGLGPTDNFCMGGPGVIMSRSVLKKLAPHLEHCLKSMVSSHEDVEVGRCVRKHVGVSCTWAFEMQWIFYHNQSKTNSFHWDLDTKAVQNAITLHPIKNPEYMYRIHTHFLTQNIMAVQQRSTLKSKILRNLKKLTKTTLTKLELTGLKVKEDLHENVPKNSTLHWELFSPKKLYSIKSPPIQRVQHSLNRGLNLILRKTLLDINLEARKVIFRELLLSKVNLGYIRLAPTQGLQFIFDFRMIMYQHIGFSRRKLPINVQYRAHVQQRFGNLIYSSSPAIDKTTQPYVNIILPLAGRLEAFRRFLSNFERNVLKRDEKVRLVIMYFPKTSDPKEHQQLVKNYADKYTNFDVIWQPVKGDFSRGLALQRGVDQLNSDSLLFFCDVDLAFKAEFFNRCRLNTVKNKQVYYPTVFSQFNQSISDSNMNYKNLQARVSNTRHDMNLNYDHFKAEHGFWRKYGYGIVCVYGEDVINVGGFDLSIKGWGFEDLRLYQQFVTSGRYDVIRTPDPGLIHIYHAASCTANLDPSQLEACHASALSQLANTGSLVNYMTKKGYL